MIPTLLRTHLVVNTTTIHLLMSNQNLHAGDEDTRAEVMVKTESMDYYPDPFWTGEPEKALRVVDWLSRNLKKHEAERHAAVLAKMQDVLLDRQMAGTF